MEFLTKTFVPETFVPQKSLIEQLDMPFLNSLNKQLLTLKDWYEDVLMLEEYGIKDLLFLDTETSHLNGFACSIAFVKTDIYGNEIFKKYFELNPGVKMDPEAIAVHKITDEQVKDALSFNELMSEIDEIFDNSDVIVAYNAIYDIGVFIREYQRVGVLPHKLLNRFIDAMAPISMVVESFDINGKKKKNAKLSEAAEYLEVSTESLTLHNALVDTELLKNTFFAALNK